MTGVEARRKHDHINVVLVAVLGEGSALCDLVEACGVVHERDVVAVEHGVVIVDHRQALAALPPLASSSISGSNAKN